MPQETRTQYVANIEQHVEDNNSKNITPEDLRDRFVAISDSVLWYNDGADDVSGNEVRFDKPLGRLIGLFTTLTSDLVFNLTNALKGAKCLVVYKGTSMPTLPAYVDTDALTFKTGGTQYWEFTYIDGNTVLGRSVYSDASSSIIIEESASNFLPFDAIAASDGMSIEQVAGSPASGDLSAKLSPISKVYDWQGLSSQTISNVKNKPTYLVGRDTSGGTNITLPQNAGAQEGDGFRVIHDYSYRYDAVRLTIPSGGTYAQLTEELNTDYFILPMGSEIEFVFDGTKWIQIKLARVNDRGRFKGSSSTAYTLEQGDEHVRIEFTTTSGVDTTITLPNSLPVGWSTEFINRGAGRLVIQVESGGTLLSNGSIVAEENEMAFVEVRNKSSNNNTWIIVGNLSN